MGSALIGLAAAVVGVTGTLIASVLSQRLLARVQSEQFDRQQQLAEAQWRREQQAAELNRRRDGYLQVNASFRRYRTRLMDFHWTVHKEAVTPEARELVEEARRDHHAVFAEAQLIASAAVLAELDGMTAALSEAYRRIMSLAEGTPDPDGSFDDLRTDFAGMWERWVRMRDVMRADIGAGNDPGGQPLIAPRQPPSLPAGGPQAARAA
ncbi:hypothetical protein P8A21_12945 [Streptomyces poriferorum]|uniref:hypothetical protein n=1 Tax=Streptomyces TaxID=1883 RepID=UPI00273F91D4|nr:MULTISPECIES: hypothetical protein [unclassified Streptomyces]WLQ48351.1 hypothetical protein P8A21_12945 [Streptomyces sp. Alt1]WSI63173.1 hypothetical protein OG471_14385 [Streptomyces sp. NBC_01336]